MIDQRKRIFAVNLWILDMAFTTASFFMAYYIRLLFDSRLQEQGYRLLQLSVYLQMFAIILPTWAILLPIFQVYSNLALPPKDQILRLTKAIALAGMVSAVILLFMQVPLNRIIVLLTLFLNYILLVSYRVLRMKKHTALDVRHVAIVGSGPSAKEVARKIEEHRNWGLKLVGVFTLGEVRPLLEAGGIDELIIAPEKVAGKEEIEQFNDTFLLCEELGITARFVLNFFPHSIARMELLEFDGLPLLSFSTTPSNEAILFVRRIMDILVALFVGLFFALPLTAICAMIIKLTSRGPALFKQERCGLNGRPFIMYKLRSMVDEAEQLRVELEYLNEMDGPVFKSSRDPRVTGIGRIMRRFSIDELPQIFNVLRGDMSLVGPRPPLPQEVARYERWQRRRLSMKPGLTCLWQVSGRNEIGFQDWMKLDLTYIDNWSLLLDLKILLKTVPVVLMGRGAK